MREDGEELLIKPGMGALHYWRDIWRYRELFFFLAWRDILVRYKQTAIGIAWSVIRPLVSSTFLHPVRAAGEIPGLATITPTSPPSCTAAGADACVRC